MPYTQDNKLISIETPLGSDVLLLESFKGGEGLSRLFSFELTMISENHAISFDQIIGKNVTVSIVRADGANRYFNGFISSFSQGRGGGEQGGAAWYSSYRALMVPWFWMLTKTKDSRIFQNLTVSEIVEKVFQDQGFTDYRFSLQGSYEKREYCVQYRESDFNFVSRLLEEEGIYYFFEHENGKHTMVIADSPKEHNPCPGQKNVCYELSSDGVREDDAVTSFELTQQLCSVKYTHKDFNFKVPNTDLKAEVQSQSQTGPGDRELYEYPGGYEKKSEGDRLAKIRIEEDEAQFTRIFGESDCRSFSSGYRFNLQEHYRRDLNKEYLLVALHHDASDGFGIDAKQAYSNTFECIPYSVPYRPPVLTPKPTVQGSQTAIVVGPSGEEIYTDEHGRVKVQFHWDREGNKDEKSSCWIRVAQLWAGAGWGAMYIPRIGQEVIVDFLEGDPDRPIITGRVYHGINTPPYPLPGEKTKSTIKSDSSLGGGGFNEFRFEDKKGSEEVFLHGQKDWTIDILHDKNQIIGHDETLLVKNNRTKTVGVNQSETVGVNKTIKVGSNHTEIIGGSMTLTVGANKTETVAVNTAETIGAAKELTIGGVYLVSIGGAMNEIIGGAKAEEIGGAKVVVIGGVSTETVGTNKLVKAGGKITLEADGEIHIKSGTKVLIEAPDVQIIGSGYTKVESGGANDIKGNPVKLNC